MARRIRLLVFRHLHIKKVDVALVGARIPSLVPFNLLALGRRHVQPLNANGRRLFQGEGLRIHHRRDRGGQHRAGGIFLEDQLVVPIQAVRVGREPGEDKAVQSVALAGK